MFRHVEKIRFYNGRKNNIIVVGNKIDRVEEREFTFETAQ